MTDRAKARLAALPLAIAGLAGLAAAGIVALDVTLSVLGLSGAPVAEAPQPLPPDAPDPNDKPPSTPSPQPVPPGLPGPPGPSPSPGVCTRMPGGLEICDRP